MLPRDTLMSPSAALLAANQEEPSAAVLVAIKRAGRCILQCVLSVARHVKYPSNLAKADQSIVVIATTRLSRPAGDSLVVAGLKGAGTKLRRQSFKTGGIPCFSAGLTV